MSGETGQCLQVERQKRQFKKRSSPGYPIKQPLSVISSINEIMLRIKTAEPESPIAVFNHRYVAGLVAVFGDTIGTRKLATKENRYFVGMFDKNSDLKFVSAVLLSIEATQRH